MGIEGAPILAQLSAQLVQQQVQIEIAKLHEGIARPLVHFGGLVIGLAQMIAVVPGLSRSGTTISAGMLRGFDRTFAVKFSFFLSIPAVLGANLLSLVKAISAGINWAEVPMYLCGVAAALVSGYLAIFALNRIAQRGKFGGFCYYCWGAGLLTLILSLIS